MLYGEGEHGTLVHHIPTICWPCLPTKANKGLQSWQGCHAGALPQHAPITRVHAWQACDIRPVGGGIGPVINNNQNTKPHAAMRWAGGGVNQR